MKIVFNYSELLVSEVTSYKIHTINNWSFINGFNFFLWTLGSRRYCWGCWCGCCGLQRCCSCKRYIIFVTICCFKYKWILGKLVFIFNNYLTFKVLRTGIKFGKTLKNCLVIQMYPILQLTMGFKVNKNRKFLKPWQNKKGQKFVGMLQKWRIPDFPLTKETETNFYFFNFAKLQL